MTRSCCTCAPSARARRPSRPTPTACARSCWCADAGLPPALDRPTVAKFTTALLDGGAEAATARSRQLAVRRFSAWLAAEGEIPDDQLAGLVPPKLDTKAIDPLSDEQLRVLLAACKGPEMRDKRDEAIIRLMTETGARAGEVLALETADVDRAAARPPGRSPQFRAGGQPGG